MTDAETARIAEIKARLDWMSENYEGCDWCCGGGAEERTKLCEELRALGVNVDDFGDAL